MCEEEKKQEEEEQRQPGMMPQDDEYDPSGIDDTDGPHGRVS